VIVFVKKKKKKAWIIPRLNANFAYWGMYAAYWKIYSISTNAVVSWLMVIFKIQGLNEKKRFK